MAVKTKNPLLLVLFLHPVPKVAFGLPEPSDHFRSIFVVSSHYRRYVANSHYGRKGAEACLWSERRRRVRRRRRAVVRRRRIRNDHGRLHLHCRRAFPQHLMVDVVIYCLANEGKDSVDEAVMVQSAQEEKDGVLLKRGPSSPGATERSDPWRRRQHRRSGGVAGPVRIEIPSEKANVSCPGECERNGGRDTDICVYKGHRSTSRCNRLVRSYHTAASIRRVNSAFRLSSAVHSPRSSCSSCSWATVGAALFVFVVPWSSSSLWYHHWLRAAWMRKMRRSDSVHANRSPWRISWPVLPAHVADKARSVRVSFFSGALLGRRFQRFRWESSSPSMVWCKKRNWLRRGKQRPSGNHVPFNLVFVRRIAPRQKSRQRRPTLMALIETTDADRSRCQTDRHPLPATRPQIRARRALSRGFS
ncbi:hypothetical protein IWX47DRAFT_867625 [Phyllosticta citricarpa]